MFKSICDSLSSEWRTNQSLPSAQGKCDVKCALYFMVCLCVTFWCAGMYSKQQLGPEGPSDPHGPPSTPNKPTHFVSCEDGVDIPPPITLWLIHRIFYLPLLVFFFPKAKAIQFILQWSLNSCSVTQMSSAEKSHISSTLLYDFGNTVIVHYISTSSTSLFLFQKNTIKIKPVVLRRWEKTSDHKNIIRGKH